MGTGNGRSAGNLCARLPVVAAHWISLLTLPPPHTPTPQPVQAAQPWRRAEHGRRAVWPVWPGQHQLGDPSGHGAGSGAALAERCVPPGPAAVCAVHTLCNLPGSSCPRVFPAHMRRLHTTQRAAPIHHPAPCPAPAAALASRIDGRRIQRAYEFAVDVAAGPPDSMFRCVWPERCRGWHCKLQRRTLRLAIGSILRWTGRGSLLAARVLGWMADSLACSAPCVPPPAGTPSC